jgi:hypothetical protein
LRFEISGILIGFKISDLRFAISLMGKVVFHGFGVEVLSFPLDHGYGPLGTFSETGSETVTVMFGNKARLAVYKLYGPFRACRHALATAVTFFIIYIDYLSFDSHC